MMNVPVSLQTFEDLDRITHLGVRQVREMVEIFTGWETRNRYSVVGPDGRPYLYAGETSAGLGGFFLRQFLRNKRPFTLQIKFPDGRPALTIKRPFTWIFPRIEIYVREGLAALPAAFTAHAPHPPGWQAGQGFPLGEVRRRFSILNRVYSIEDGLGNPLAAIVGPLWRPWTFKILREDREIGAIRKHWSGLLTETFSAADRFGVEFGAGMDRLLRVLGLCATFLIDFVHFERRS